MRTVSCLLSVLCLFLAIGCQTPQPEPAPKDKELSQTLADKKKEQKKEEEQKTKSESSASEGKKESTVAAANEGKKESTVAAAKAEKKPSSKVETPVNGAETALSKVKEGVKAATEKTVEKTQKAMTTKVSRVEKTAKEAVAKVEKKPAVPKVTSEMLAKQAWEKAKKADTSQAYKLFLEKFPKSPFAEQAKKKLALTAEREFFLSARGRGLEGYRSYLKKYPKGRFAAQARQALEELMFARVKRSGSLQAIDQFLREFPQSPLKAKALALKKQIMANTVAKALRQIEKAPLEEAVKIQKLRQFLSKYGKAPWREVAAPYFPKVHKLISSLELMQLRRSQDPRKFYNFLRKNPRHPNVREVRYYFHKTLAARLAKPDKWTLFYYKFLVQPIVEGKSRNPEDVIYLEGLAMAYALSKMWLDSFLVYQFAIYTALQQGESREEIGLLQRQAEIALWKHFQTPWKERNSWSFDSAFLRKVRHFSPDNELADKRKKQLRKMEELLLKAIQKSSYRPYLLLFARTWRQDGCLVALGHFLPKSAPHLRALEGVLSFGETGVKMLSALVTNPNVNARTNALLALGIVREASVMRQVMQIEVGEPKVQVARDFYLLRMGDEGARLRLIQALLSGEESAANLAAFCLRYSGQSLPLSVVEQALAQRDSYRQFQLLSSLQPSHLDDKWLEKLAIFSHHPSSLVRSRVEYLLSDLAKRYPKQWEKVWAKSPADSLFLAVSGASGVLSGFQKSAAKILQEGEKKALLKALILLQRQGKLELLSAGYPEELLSQAKALGEGKDLGVVFRKAQTRVQQELYLSLAREVGQANWAPHMISWMDNEPLPQYNKEFNRKVRLAILAVAE